MPVESEQNYVSTVQLLDLPSKKAGGEKETVTSQCQPTLTRKHGKISFNSATLCHWLEFWDAIKTQHWAHESEYQRKVIFAYSKGSSFLIPRMTSVTKNVERESIETVFGKETSYWRTETYGTIGWSGELLEKREKGREGRRVII